MTKEEWLEIGFEKNIIDGTENCSSTFRDVYMMWFAVKMKTIKPQSLDRIECAYNKWYCGDINECVLATITEQYIYEYLNKIIVSNRITKKEFARIYQIFNNVMIYAYDMRIMRKCINFDVVKRYVAYDKLCSNDKDSCIVDDSYIDVLFEKVIKDRIYPEKQTCCLLWLLNFYLGLRIGELSSLKFNDFDLVRKVLCVRKTQTKYHNRDSSGKRTGSMSYDIEECCKTVSSVREVPLCINAIDLYHLIREEHEKRGYDSEYLAYSGSNVVLTRSMDRCLTRLFKLCNLQHCKSHYIRKTVATQLHVNNVPTRVISDILGHSEISTTERYYIVSTKDIEKYIEYMNASLHAMKSVPITDTLKKE